VERESISKKTNKTKRVKDDTRQKELRERRTTSRKKQDDNTREKEAKKRAVNESLSLSHPLCCPTAPKSLPHSHMTTNERPPTVDPLLKTLKDITATNNAISRENALYEQYLRRIKATPSLSGSPHLKLTISQRLFIASRELNDVKLELEKTQELSEKFLEQLRVREPPPTTTKQTLSELFSNCSLVGFSLFFFFSFG
jgi:hypothetical protein